MTAAKSGKRLHDRATRGETLSAEEQKQLAAWYAEQDRAERAMLERNDPDANYTPIQSQVEQILFELNAATRRIQEISQENENLRQEIRAFRRQLTQQTAMQIA